jgi:hypothetical protein
LIRDYEMPYLICDRCNGYYKLQEGESEDHFQGCQCGGNLLYTNHIENIQPSIISSSYTNDDKYLEKDNQKYIIENDHNDDQQHTTDKLDDSHTSHTISIKKLSSLVLFFLMISVVGAASFNNLLPVNNNSKPADQSILGSNDKGYVNKYVYPTKGSNSTEKKKIAIVTGIHPREHLSKTVWTDVLKNYNLNKDTQIVQYDINVVDSPNNFTIGRNNGENLAATYILPDVLKSKYDLIIVCHDHQPGYGEGFFFATPKMDEKSVKFTEALTQRLPFFNYYQSNGTEHAASNAKFTIPLASNGYRTLVYEIPGLNSYSEVYNKTSELLDTSIQLI